MVAPQSCARNWDIITANRTVHLGELFSRGRKDSSDAFDVVQRSRSRIDIIVGHKTLHRIIDGVEKNKYYLYLTTPDGNSKKALYGAKDVPLRQIKLEDAVPAFTARKAYWLKMEPEIERTSPLSPTASPKP